MAIKYDEKDIEDWLYENPNSLNVCGRWTVDKWIGRQYKVPSGIIDLLGVAKAKYGDGYVYFVVEVKNVDVTPDALTQVCRYSQDIRRILFEAAESSGLEYWKTDFEPSIFKIVIAPIESLDSKVMFEASALNVIVISCEANLTIKIGGHFHWTDEKRKQIDEQYDLLAKDFEEYFQKDVFEEFISTLPDLGSKEE